MFWKFWGISNPNLICHLLVSNRVASLKSSFLVWRVEGKGLHKTPKNIKKKKMFWKFWGTNHVQGAFGAASVAFGRFARGPPFPLQRNTKNQKRRSWR